MSALPHAIAPSVAQNHARVSRRRGVERLMRLAAHLPDADRLLLEQVYEQGLSIPQLARLTGRPRRSVNRRVNNLLRRVQQPLFVHVAERADLLPSERRRVARLVVLEGLPLRAAADAAGLSLHQVRQHMLALRTAAGA